MLGVIRFPFVAAPGFLAMVIVMSVALTREWRRSHERMQALLDNVPAVVYLKDLDGRYLFANRHFAHVYRLSPINVLGRTDAQLFDANRAAAHAEADREAISRGTLESEEVIDQPTGLRTYAQIRYAMRDTDGGVYALCGIATDVTERKTATDVLRDLSATLERRVARRTNELAQLNRELEAFAYSVSHDLRAPLTAVNGFAELLLREHGPRLDQSANRYLNRIRDGSLRMAALIQDLLGLSRVTQQSLERQSTDLAPLIDASLKALREQEPTRSITIAAPTHLPAHGDPKLLSVALNNLLANAWKYTSKTTDARIEIGALERDGETVYYVKDNGAGFNPDQTDRLFRPFVRLHSDSEFPGTGIGLATVARIVNRHGGRIWAQGMPNEGATFFFTLPVAEEDDNMGSTTIVRGSAA
jgi:PAS domain S-box-containing protein